jgi:regulator of chromosome condensation
VVELEDLPTGRIKKLAAGGYLLLALTEGNDLYGWGGHPGRPAFIEEVSGDPTPLLIEEKDIADCAVGESHAIVLTTEGEVYVIGDNTNGQLGMAVEKVVAWTKVPINLAPGSSVSSVACGPRNSFVLVNKNTNKS